MFLNYIRTLNLSEDIIEDFDSVPGLDPEMPWIEEASESALMTQERPDVDTYTIADIKAGDIISADVYQDNQSKINLNHKSRPFLVTSKGYDRVYGLQLTHDPSYTMKECSVPIEDFRVCGLNNFGYITANMVRGVEYKYINYIIGHISDFTKDALLDKLYEIRDNSDGIFSDLPIQSRINKTIESVYKIIVR